ncbi:glycosyltransferase family 2 protein [Thermococcus atlanticus]
MSVYPLISIITPTYNHEEFIIDCIRSVLSQTYKNWEMIIIDDGSKDNTIAIVEKYRDYDDRIHIIKQKHRGIWQLNKTYNKAFKFSDGDLIAILEGDDFWPPYKLDIQQRAFKKDESIVLAWGKAYLFYQGRILGITPKNIKVSRINKEEWYIPQLLLKNYIPAVTVMIKREALESIGGFKQNPIAPYVDYTTWLELSLLGKFKFINNILGYWRRHPSQITNNATIEIAKAAKEISSEFVKGHRIILKQKGINIKRIEQEIQETYEKRLSVAYFMKSLSELNKEKLSFFIDEALFRGNLTIKLRALLIKNHIKAPHYIILPKFYYKS